MRNKIVAAFFCLLLAVSVAAGLLTPDRYYSPREKRVLAQTPQWSARSFFSGEYAKALESYLADQLPGRDSWITLKTWAELAMGKRESGGVYIGKDGYLMDKFSAYSEKTLEANAAAFQSLAQKLEKEGIPMEILLVPAAAQALPGKLPPFAPVADYEAMAETLRRYSLNTLTILDALQSYGGEYIYYRTDHHWTSLGAYYAYCAWRESNGLPARPLSYWTEEIMHSRFYGTTWNKVPLPGIPADTITAYYRGANRKVVYNFGSYKTNSIYETSFLAGKDPYGVFFNSNQALTVVDGGGETGKLLIIKDSFANTFAQFVLEDYAEVHMIDLRFFREDVAVYAAENGITRVLVLYGAQNFAANPIVIP